MAIIHKQQKGAFIPCHKHIAFNGQEFRIDLSRPDMSFLRILHLFLKMKDNGMRIFTEKALTFSHTRHIGRTGGAAAVIAAAEHALHAHPLSRDNLAGLNPAKIGDFVFPEYFLQTFNLFKLLLRP
jgi:hypothetical protein